ncbi:MAG: SDR family NAD(P)-dependent oxidoreductase [Planctomycetes bacterium]|nr:SDR family NAD(P)-dependent oxidoreductase [Planctomycetota bacterium]
MQQQQQQQTSQPLRVLITGASSGIGRGLAQWYAHRGHTVGALARRQDLLEELAAAHSNVVPLIADVCDAEQTEQAVSRFALEAGGLDVAYANAGVGQRTREEGWDADRAELIAQVNVVGATNTICAATSIMLEQGRGHLVGISSLAGHCPLPDAAAYGASKAWLVFYLRSLAMDLGPCGIRCTVVMPGYVSTQMVDGTGVELLTPQARRAADRIAQGVARGQETIRFPRRVSLLTRLAGLTPASLRASMQRRRLHKRATSRSQGR